MKGSCAKCHCTQVKISRSPDERQPDFALGSSGLRNWPHVTGGERCQRETRSLPVHTGKLRPLSGAFDLPELRRGHGEARGSAFSEEGAGNRSWHGGGDASNGNG